MNRYNIIGIAFILFSLSSIAQKQANILYFGDRCGLDFNSGEPIVTTDYNQNNFMGSASVCDSLGSLVIYSEGKHIWNREHDIMMNGEDLAGGGDRIATQRVLIVKQPGSDNIYFVFIVGRGTYTSNGLRGLWYSVVDINGDNGLGEVIERDVFLNAAWDAQEKLFAANHQNNEDIWIITRKFQDQDHQYASFLLSPSGLNTTPVYSSAVVTQFSGLENVHGYSKISYDKKYLLTAHYFANPDAIVEICKFNDTTGVIEYLYYEMKVNQFGDKLFPYGIEFSPDSKFVYISYHDTNPVEDDYIYQYEMQYIENAILFAQSAILINIGPGRGLQLATDGKIYCSMDGGDTPYHHVSVIHKPWERGLACDFEADAINMGNREVWYCFPNILLDHLYRFEWEGSCSGPDNAITFKPNFQPTPVSITWNFSDPTAGDDSISTELYPVHYFTHGGEFEVSVDVNYPPTPNYPFGRFEHTSRVVTVKQSPHPNLGSDTLVCEGTEVTLNAGNEDGFYSWSDGTTFGHNIFDLTVADTGIHWVQVTNTEGCRTRDSIHIGWFNKAVFNESNMVITPTSCGGSNGSIMGIQIDGVLPVSTEWYDANGNIIGNTINIGNLSVGNYFLHVTDTNGCITISDSYTITDAGNILITAVDFSPSHCSQSIGSITITASSGTGTNFLYSILNGASGSWQPDSLFINLPSGDYFIKVKDPSGCETVYGNNPVVIENIEGPNIITENVSHENDYLADGSIYLEAIVDIGSIQYSIDSGYNFQTNNGLFENLSAGTYYCIVKDEFGCDTTFTLVIDRIISQIIDAIAGDGSTCIGNATASPLILNNFTDVSRFHVMLTYEQDLITCDGYMQVNPVLKDSLIVTTNTSGEVHINWEGQSPISLPNNSLMTELVFSAIDNGLSQVDWVADQGESQFFNKNGEQINTDYELGYILIYTRPNIFLAPTNEVCEGESLFVISSIEGGSGVNTSHWVGPDDFTSNGQLLWFNEVRVNMAGIYTLTVTDSLDCVESKSMVISVNQGTEIAFSEYDTLWVEPGFILEAGYGAEFYYWNTGETSETIVIDSMGNYSVELTSFEGCKSTDTVQILWSGTPFYLPNAFTPNGDGLNDSFKAIPRYDYVNKYHLNIYNRWGQRIYETTDINSGWDGSYKGSPCIIGAYVYHIVYEEFGQQPVESKVVEGTVVLVR